MKALFYMIWFLSSVLGNPICQGVLQAESMQMVLWDNPQMQDQGDAKEMLNLKVNVNLVTIDVRVHGKRGGCIGDLQPKDFEIYDNGVVQQITCFSHDELPLAIALVIDRSGSIRPYLSLLHSAAQSALQLLKPGDKRRLMLKSVASASLDTTLYGFNDIFKRR
jgi:hypothetical protein